MQAKDPLVAQLICPPVFLVGVLESRHQSESQAIKSEIVFSKLTLDAMKGGIVCETYYC